MGKINNDRALYSTDNGFEYSLRVFRRIRVDDKTDKSGEHYVGQRFPTGGPWACHSWSSAEQ